jgi:hypothetical protein
MKYTYAIPGRSRTGTTSLWAMLKKHPQVAVSKEKDYIFTHGVEDTYIKDAFNIKKDTKVLFEGTADWLYFVQVAVNLEQIKRACCIYILRDPKERMISLIDFRNRTHCFESAMFELKEDNILQFDYLKEMEKIIGRDNIILINLDEIEKKQNRIYEFLEIDNIYTKFPKKNAITLVNPNIQQLYDKIKIIEEVEKFFQEYSDVSEKQIELMYKRYKVL